MSDIFISYAHEDRPMAEALAGVLEAQSLSVWWDTDIRAGGYFDEVIERELANCLVTIVLWSRHSVASRWVRDEAAEALSQKKLVPLFLERGVVLPLTFKRVQAADFSTWDRTAGAAEFQDLLADIRHRVGPSSPEVPLPPTPLEPPREKRTEEPRQLPQPSGASWADRNSLLQTRTQLTVVLAAVFVLNYVETFLETKLRHEYGLGVDLGERIASAFMGLEGNLTFDFHDVTSSLAVYGYSIAYFFLFPLVGIGLVLALWQRAELSSYRLYCLALTVCYALSFLFFVLFPVPERWAVPDSRAVLLSDLWSSRLIDALRPISGIDNCFPSSHVSMTVVMILVAFLVQVRLRFTVLAIGLMVILSTFALGIHWIPDIIAGTAVGILSVAIARYLTRAPTLPKGLRRVAG